MNLYDRFETAPDAESEGVWVDIGDGMKILVARAGNPAHKGVVDRLTKPYRAVLRAGGNLPPDTQLEVAIESAAEAILLDGLFNLTYFVTGSLPSKWRRWSSKSKTTSSRWATRSSSRWSMPPSR